MVNGQLNANLPVQWLNDPVRRGLSPVAWALHTFALMWCVSQGCDGTITSKALPLIYPQGVRRATCERGVQELLTSGLWIATDDGFQVHDWTGSQTTAANRAGFHVRKAKNQHDFRTRQVDAAAGASPESQGTGAPVTGHSPVTPSRDKSSPVQASRGEASRGGYDDVFATQPFAEYDDAFASDPGLAYEADDWVVDSVDGTRHHRVTGAVLDD